VVIFAAGTGNPFFSTDTTAALRAAEMEADIIFLAKKVDAVYDSDPDLNPNAKKYKHLTHTDVLEKNLKVMDSTAASLCRDNKITVHVFGLAEENGIMRACLGEDIGTIIE
jgi:uridylate kinase